MVGAREVPVTWVVGLLELNPITELLGHLLRELLGDWVEDIVEEDERFAIFKQSHDSRD